MTLFIDLGCLYCKQTQRAFNVFKNNLNWLKIDSVDQKFNWLECGNFSQDAGMPGTERIIAFSQLAVKGLKVKKKATKTMFLTCWQNYLSYMFTCLSYLFYLLTGEKPHVCDVCEKGFSTSSSLNTHRRIHSGEKPHRCPVCGKCFTASSNLYYHRMTHNKVGNSQSQSQSQSVLFASNHVHIHIGVLRVENASLPPPTCATIGWRTIR
jgi:uncharacterized Zn-finger protein